MGYGCFLLLCFITAYGSSTKVAPPGTRISLMGMGMEGQRARQGPDLEPIDPETTEPEDAHARKEYHRMLQEYHREIAAKERERTRQEYEELLRQQQEEREKERAKSEEKSITLAPDGAQDDGPISGRGRIEIIVLKPRDNTTVATPATTEPTQPVATKSPEQIRLEKEETERQRRIQEEHQRRLESERRERLEAERRRLEEEKKREIERERERQELEEKRLEVERERKRLEKERAEAEAKLLLERQAQEKARIAEMEAIIRRREDYIRAQINRQEADENEIREMEAERINTQLMQEESGASPQEIERRRQEYLRIENERREQLMRTREAMREQYQQLMLMRQRLSEAQSKFDEMKQRYEEKQRKINEEMAKEREDLESERRRLQSEHEERQRKLQAEHEAKQWQLEEEIERLRLEAKKEREAAEKERITAVNVATTERESEEKERLEQEAEKRRQEHEAVLAKEREEFEKQKAEQEAELKRRQEEIDRMRAEQNEQEAELERRKAEEKMRLEEDRKRFEEEQARREEAQRKREEAAKRAREEAERVKAQYEREQRERAEEERRRQERLEMLRKEEEQRKKRLETEDKVAVVETSGSESGTAVEKTARPDHVVSGEERNEERKANREDETEAAISRHPQPHDTIVDAGRQAGSDATESGEEQKSQEKIEETSAGETGTGISGSGRPTHGPGHHQTSFDRDRDQQRPEGTGLERQGSGDPDTFVKIDRGDGSETSVGIDSSDRRRPDSENGSDEEKNTVAAPLTDPDPPHLPVAPFYTSINIRERQALNVAQKRHRLSGSGEYDRFSRIWNKLRFGPKKRRGSTFRESKTLLERSWDKMRGYRRARNQYQLGDTYWTAAGQNRHQLRRDAGPAPDAKNLARMYRDTYKQIPAELHGQAGAQVQPRVGKIFSKAANRYYWYSRDAYNNDIYRNQVDGKWLPSEDVLQCTHDLPAHLPDGEGGKVNYVVFNCDRRLEKCCGTDCCQNYFLPSGSRAPTASSNFAAIATLLAALLRLN